MKKLVFFLVAIVTSFCCNAYDFSSPIPFGDGQLALYYNIKSATTVELVGPGGEIVNPWFGYTRPSGNITLPSTVTYSGQTYTVVSIAKYALSQCSSLSSVTIPNTVKKIGYRAFYQDVDLTIINLPSSGIIIEKDAFYNTGWYIMKPANEVMYLGSALIGYKGTLPYYAVDVPSNIKTIAGGAFEGSNVVDVDWPNTLECIGPHAFYNCNVAVTSLPDSLKIIGTAAFYNCDNISGTLSIPEGITEIPDSAFEYCDYLTGVNFPNTLTTIGRSAFWSSGLTSVTIPQNVISMKMQCMPWESLQTVNYNAINCIGPNYTIFGGESVRYFNIGDSVQTLPNLLISGCAHLNYITFPNSLISIGEYNFTNCGLIGNVILPESLVRLGENAFNNCTSIDSIICTALVPPAGSGSIFLSCHDKTLYVPCSSVSAYQADSRWGAFTNIMGIGGCNHTISLSVNNPDRGTVSGGGTFGDGTTITITAIANSGFCFDHWSDGNTQNPRTITVSEDISLTAYFVQDIPTYNVTVSSCNTNMGYVSGGGTFVAGTVITISANARNSYRFLHWSNGNRNRQYTFEVTNDVALMAIFDIEGDFYQDTLLIHDTIIQTIPIHDTTLIVDTVILTEYDTTYIGVHDTTYINVPVHDTTVVTDTVTLTQFDTITNTVYDTIDRFVYDTVFLTDTIWLHDTIYIHDTVYITQEGIDGAEALNAKVYSSQGQIVIEGAGGNAVTLFDVNGRRLATKQDYGTEIRFDALASGTYMIKIGNYPARKVVVIR